MKKLLIIPLLILLCGCNLLMQDIIGNGYVYNHKLPATELKDPPFIEARMESYFKDQELWVHYNIITGTRVDSAQMRIYIEDGGTYSNPVQLFDKKDALKFDLTSIPDSLQKVILGDFKPPKPYDYNMVLYLWRGDTLWTNADEPFKFKTSEPR